MDRRSFLGAVAASPLPLPRKYSEPLAPVVAALMANAVPGGLAPIQFLIVRKSDLQALCRAIGQGEDHWAFTWGTPTEDVLGN